MLDLKQIESFYPEHFRVFKKNIIREYLQYKILEIIYDTKYAAKLAFMGGTAIRIIHGSNRFSEDLDFDNFNLSKEEFEKLIQSVQKQLMLEGYTIEVRYVFKRAFHGYISISGILYEYKISSHKEEKLMIRLDTEPQRIAYSPQNVIINKFDIFTGINVVPPNLLLSQKILAILNRKRAMGRDFFDTVYLFSRAKPDFDYLKHYANITTMAELKKSLLKKCDTLNLKLLARDVEPFLVNPGDAKKVLLFRDYIKYIETK